MKRNIFLLTLLINFPLVTFSQKCKPDIKFTDRITKIETVAWQTKISEPISLLVMKSRTDDIYVSIGKADGHAFMSLILLTTYSVKTDAQFDTPYLAETGKKIHLGFANSDPLSFSVSLVSNKKKVTNENGVLDTKTNELNSLAQSTILLFDEDLEKLKKVISKDLVNFIRIELANNMVFEREIKKTKSEALKAKFICFFDNSSDLKHLSISERTTGKEAPSNVISTNISNQKSSSDLGESAIPETQNNQKPTINNTLNEVDNKWIGKYKCNTGETWVLMEDKAYVSTDLKGKNTKGEWSVSNSIFTLKREAQAQTMNYNIEKLTESQFIIKNYTASKTITCSRTELLNTKSATNETKPSINQTKTANTDNLQQPSGTQLNSSYVGVADELLKYKQLVDAGLMTKQEFEIQKRRLLNIETPTSTVKPVANSSLEKVENINIDNKQYEEKIVIGDNVIWIDAWKKQWEGEVISINKDIAKVKVIDKGKEVVKTVYIEKVRKSKQ